MQSKMNAVRAKVTECIEKAERRFSIKMPPVQVRFDLTGKAAGIAGYQRSSIGVSHNFYLRFNVNHMSLGGKSWEHILNDVVPHEVAHTVCQAFPQHGRNHDHGWKRVCLALGGNGNRCYNSEDAPEAIAMQRPYVYTTSTGQTVAIGQRHHNKVQRGVTYNFKGKGTVNRHCAYTVQTPQNIAPVAAPAYKAPAAWTQRATQPTSGLSKADLIRLRIKQAKATGEMMAKVVQYGIEVLGMPRALATSYTRNNWSKV